MDKIKFKVRGSDIIGSLNEHHKLNEGLGGIGTEIGLSIDKPNCEETDTENKDNESTSVSCISTPPGRLHPEQRDEEDIEEAAEESEDEVEDTESEEEEPELHTGIVRDEDGKLRVQCPECGSRDVNIHDNGLIFHCVACGYEWPTKDADDDGIDDEEEEQDDILVQDVEDGEEYYDEEENESMVIEAVDMKKRVKIYYDNVNKQEFDRDYGKFLDKINFYLKHALGSKEDGLTDSLKAYIECSEVVGRGKWIDLYIYGWRDDYERDEKSSSELTKIMVSGTKAIERLVGDYLDVMPTTLWSAKIEIKGKKTEVGPYILYRWSEKEMDKVIGESRPVIETFVDEGMATWSFEYHDNGGGHKSFSVKANDKTSAIDKGMAKAKKQAKGDITSWDCKLIKA